MNTKPQIEGLPVSVHTEIAILGAMLLYPAQVPDAVDRLVPEDFSLDSHAIIFKCISDLHRRGSGIDSMTVRNELERTSNLSRVGGFEYILRLEDGIPRNLNLDSYIGVLKSKAMLRDAMRATMDLLEAAPSYDAEPRELLERAVARFQSMLETDDTLDIPTVGDYLRGFDSTEDMFASLTTKHGIRLGWTQWDEHTLGAQPGDLVVIAARPSMGKTAWACNAASSTALRGMHTALFTLEQRKPAIIRRMLSSLAQIDAKLIRKGELRREDRLILNQRRQMLAAAPLHIDDAPGMTASRIRAKCARLKRTVGLDIAFIDQLSHVNMADCKERDFRLKVGEQTKMFKRMAIDLGIPVVVFNQLKRGENKASDTRPRLTDLKESGNIEEDADVVTLLHRPEYYDRTDPNLKGLGEMIIAKNREGETLTCTCKYDGRTQRWIDEEQSEPPPAEQATFYQKEW